MRVLNDLDSLDLCLTWLTSGHGTQEGECLSDVFFLSSM